MFIFSGCRSQQNNPCVFPFIYKDITYKGCTDVDSSNGKLWCATEVDSSGEVVDNKWEDCQENCQKSRLN